jgi:hypothetical protein
VDKYFGMGDIHMGKVYIFTKRDKSNRGGISFMPRVGITAYDLLISCPGDVNKFVDTIRECVDDFNRVYGNINNMEITTKHWSTDSYPQSGDKPQELLNKQFVRDCDAAVAIFWTKFGTPTDKYGSGTEEEIEEMLSSNKQVFMYFLDAPINPSNVDMEQYKKVQAFKEKYKDRGIYFIVKDEHELRQLFTNHLGMHFLPLAVGKKALFGKKKSPVLKIKAASLEEDEGATVEYAGFSECKLVKDKRESIISKIELLQQRYLNPRDKENTEKVEKGENSLLINSPDLNKLLGKVDFATGKIMDADIADRRKNTICKFAKENGIEIEDSFWNIGNLKKRVSTLVPFYGGSGTTFEGSEEEKKRYDSIEELYWAIVDYYEYISFFEKIDKQGLIDLTVVNIGNTFDEDIDIKIIIKKNHVCKIKDIAVPESNIIEEILKMRFLEYVYQIECNDVVVEYMGYPLQTPSLPLITDNPFNRPSAQEEYNRNKEEYMEDLNRIFCYEYYEKEDVDILVFHINYLKHNTVMAFPSVLVFKEIPDFIDYEISSKYVAEVVRGTVEIRK